MRGGYACEKSKSCRVAHKPWAPQEEDAGSEGPVGDALKRPAQRVPLDAADGDADAGEAEQDPHPASPRLDDDEGARLAPVTPDMDEEEQPPSNYVPRENRTPYMERKIRDLRVRTDARCWCLAPGHPQRSRFFHAMHMLGAPAMCCP